VDVHQHLWSEPFLEALRRRRRSPRLEGWTLILDGEPDYPVDPGAHDPVARAAAAAADGVGHVLISLSSPLGVEWLPPEEASQLLDAYHAGALALPAPFRAWAAVCLSEVVPEQLQAELDHGCVGLQLPAPAILDAAGYSRCAPLLALLETRDLPLFIHPGSAPAGSTGLPAWWPALVPYVQQMHAAWYAFLAFGRPRHPRLRVCFAMLAGLAPLHGERAAVRGAGRGAIDPDAFLETSSYGPRALDAIVRVLGIDVLVHGSDRPYARPADCGLGQAAEQAVRLSNPLRLLAPRGVPQSL
jgi:6-methylsalicylate decarboxylase